jgi:hypothetical protein
MALDVIAPSGRSGRIVVSDERSDGAVILLVSETYDSESGAVILKPEEEAPASEPGYPWPTEARSRDRAAVALPESLRPPFTIIIDTSGLPPGPQAFRSEVLLRRVFALAGDGADKAAINQSNARDWGWVSGPGGDSDGD